MSTLVQIIKEHISYKNQIFKLAKADLVKTYRGAALGWMWAIIKPAVTIFVYWFAFVIRVKNGRKCIRISVFFMANCRSCAMVLYE